MTRGEAMNWIINLTADIGKVEHRDLWHYEQALEEIRDMIEAMPLEQPDLQPTCNQLATDTISRRAAIDALAKEMPSLTTPDGTGQFDHDIQIADEAFVDAMQILNDLPSVQRKLDEWCTDCAEYDQERHCCPRFNRVIRTAIDDAQSEIVRCKECRWGREVCGNIECFVDSNIPPEYHGYEWFCPNGERI